MDPDANAGGASSAAGSPWAEAALGAVFALLGIVMFWQLAGVEVPVTYSRIGPRLFPGLVATGLILIGGGLIVGALRRIDITPMAEVEPGPVLWVAGGLLAMILLVERAGFVIAAAILFACAARAFGSRRPLRDGLIGIGLALVCQIGFNYGLGLDLPWGVLSFLD